MLVRTLGSKREWVVRSHVSWGGERSILYKGVDTFPEQTRFKNLERKPKEDNTISASGGFEPLH